MNAFLAKPMDGLALLGKGVGFLVRHGLAILVTVSVPCLLWTVLYAGLLLCAVLTGSDPGGPLAYPAGLVFCFLLSLAATLVVISPAVILAELLGRARSLPILLQIPISLGFMGLFCSIVAIEFDWSRVPGPDLHWTLRSAILFVAHLLPLGLYWWVAEGGPLVYRAASWLLARCRRSTP